MILGILSDDFHPKDGWRGSGWARIGKYLPYLPQGWDIHVAHQIWPADHDGIAITDSRGKKIYPDVLWCQRVAMPGFSASLMQARLVGQRVVTDVDDLLWDTPKGSIAEKTWGPNVLQEFIHSLKMSDAVVASTTWLATRLKAQFRIPSVVIPNTLDIERISTVHHNHGTPYIGWAGSPMTRPDDMKLMGSIFDSLPDGARYKVQHSGHIEGLPTFEETVGIKPDKLLDATTPNKYHELLTFHIGLVPLSLNDFNRAKSDIKGIEYAAAGIPFVASPLPAYKQLRKEWGGVVRLARTPDEWADHITDLLDFDTRRSEAEKLRKLAWKRDLPNAYQELKHVLLG